MKICAPDPKLRVGGAPDFRRLKATEEDSNPAQLIGPGFALQKGAGMPSDFPLADHANTTTGSIKDNGRYSTGYDRKLRRQACSCFQKMTANIG